MAPRRHGPARLAAVCVATLAGCGSRSALDRGERIGEVVLEVSGGYGDVDDTAVLGMMVTDTAGKLARTCSGALIAPNLVITAQHCIASTADFVFCDESSFGSPVAPRQVFVTTATAMWDSASEWRMAREVLAPPGGTDVCGRDVALVVLDDPLGPDEAVPLWPALDRPVVAGEPYSAIGYGETAQDEGDGGYRRRRDGLRVDCVGAECDAPTYVDAREWRGSTGICDGDSGGPAIDASGAVIGITSRGPLGCDDPIYGGLAGWRGWIRDVGTHAAAVGGYPGPGWIEGATTETSAALLDELARDGSCSVSKPRRGPGTPLGWMTLVALGAVMLRTRRPWPGRARVKRLVAFLLARAARTMP